MDKRPAGARHIRTSAQATAAPAPGFSRFGVLPETAETALDGLLTPDAVDPSALRAVAAPAEAIGALLTPQAEDGLSGADQAALDLDAILSVAFGMEPEPVAVPPAGLLSDDILDDLLGDWDLGTADDPDDDPADDPAADPADDLLAEPDVPEVPPGIPPQPAARADGAKVISTSASANRGRPPEPELNDDFDQPDDAPGEALPDLDLDDLFAIAPVPAAPSPRGKPLVEATPAPRTARENRRAAVPELDRVLQIGAARPGTWAKWRPRLIWAVILAGLVYVAFLPYPYEVGGDFVVQPLQRSEARSRTDGEIIQVDVAEGDWVKAGDILAVLSNITQLKDLALNEADDAKLRADLATMENGAKPEEIAVAREAVASAELLVSVTRKDLDRQQVLFDSGTIAEKLLDTARNAHAAAVSARDEAAARLALVASAAKPTEIDAQKASIDRNRQELEFARKVLEYTNIRAPQQGQIVSSLSIVPVGAFLPQGGLFAELENNRTVIAEVDMPETYIQEVALGARAELRLWSDPETSIFGTVRSIAPRAEERDFGWVIRVEVEVPNPDGRLAANMTGFGKVAAAERPVWQAFTEAIVGFFKIELWSWIP